MKKALARYIYIGNQETPKQCSYNWNEGMIQWPWLQGFQNMETLIFTTCYKKQSKQAIISWPQNLGADLEKIGFNYIYIWQRPPRKPVYKDLHPNFQGLGRNSQNFIRLIRNYRNFGPRNLQISKIQRIKTDIYKY